MRFRSAVLALLMAGLLGGLLAGCSPETRDAIAERVSDARASASASPSAGDTGDVAADGLPDSDFDPVSGLPWVLEVELPPNAQDTLVLIDAGGPFPYSKDGSTFQNREGILPQQYDGYYAEFTVDKPGEDDRGPWRLVTGDPDEVYWTDDHYSSFSRVWR
jgi:ribonuclease T1